MNPFTACSGLPHNYSTFPTFPFMKVTFMLLYT